MTSNKRLREIDIKKCTYYYFDDIKHIKNQVKISLLLNWI